MLQQLHSDSKQFCDEKLLAMQAELQALMLSDSSQPLAVSVGSESLRQAAIGTRQQTLFQQLGAALSRALDNSYTEFNELLEQSDSGRPLLEKNSSILSDELYPELAEQLGPECTQALGELNQRLSVLSGMKVDAARNPFSPETFAAAIEQSLLSLHWNPSTEADTRQLFLRDLLTDLPELYSAMNDTLAEAGILPQLDAANEPRQPSVRDTGQLDDAAATEAIHAPGPQPGIMPSRVITQLPANDLVAGELDEWVAAEKRAAVEQEQDKSLLETQVLTDVRDVHAAKTVALELVGDIINQLLSYDEVSLQLKVLLSRLYKPYSDLAQSDNRFPDDADHPGHHLLQSIARTVELFQTDALILQRPELVVLLKEFVNQLTEKSLTGRHAYVLAFRINSQLRGMERRIQARRIREQPALSSLDKISSVQSSIRKQVSERLRQADVRIPVKIEDFLLQTWVCYVSSLYVNPDVDRDHTERTLAMADRIIQYAGGQQRMTNNQYTVISIAVRQAMTRCGATGQEIQSFLQELKYAHAHPLANIVIGSHELDDGKQGVAKA